MAGVLGTLWAGITSVACDTAGTQREADAEPFVPAYAPCATAPVPPAAPRWSAQQDLTGPAGDGPCGEHGTRISGGSSGLLIGVVEGMCDDAGEQLAARVQIFGDNGRLGPVLYERRLDDPYVNYELGFSYAPTREAPRLMYINSPSWVSGIGETRVVDTETMEDKWLIEGSPTYSTSEYGVGLVRVTSRTAILGTVHLPEYRGELWVFDGLPAGTYGLEDATALHIGEEEKDGLGASWVVGDLDGDGFDELALNFRRALHVVDGEDLLIDQGVSNATRNQDPYEPAWITDPVVPAGDLDGDGLGDFAVAENGAGGDRQGDIVTFGARGVVKGRVDNDPKQFDGLRADPLGDVDGDGIAEAVISLYDHDTLAWFGSLPACGTYAVDEVATAITLTEGLRFAIEDTEPGAMLLWATTEEGERWLSLLQLQ